MSSNYQDLHVWQESMTLAEQIDRVTETGLINSLVRK